MKQIDISEIFKTSLSTYRKAFSKLMIFSSISAVLLILSYADAFIPRGALLFRLILSLSVLVLLILSLKFKLANQIYVENILNNREITIEESFDETRGKVWRYLGNLLLTGLLLIPMFLFAGKSYSLFITIPYNCLIVPFYFLLEPVIALEEKDALKLIKAVRLIKENYVGVAVIVFFSQILWGIPNSIAQKMFNGNVVAILIITIINGIILTFSTAFSSVMKGVLYQRLR